MSQEFSRTESLVLDALLLLDELILNPLVQGHSGTAPVTSRKAQGTNQGTNETDSRSYHHPEAGFSQTQTTRNSVRDDAYESHETLLHLSLTATCDGLITQITYTNHFQAQPLKHFPLFQYWNPGGKLIKQIFTYTLL